MSRKKPEKKEISEQWLTTYSDMVTLLLTFFVLLYSFALVDNKKFKALAASLSSSFGGKPPIIQLDNSSGATSSPLDDSGSTSSVVDSQAKDSATQAAAQAGSTKNQKDMYETVENFVDKNELNDYVTVKEGTRGVYIEFRDKILFNTGKSDIKQDAVPILVKISELIRNITNQIVIEGHTDNIPISNSEYTSNWELSSARAMNVLKYLTNSRGLSPKRFSVAAYGEYSPIASNDESEGRAENRRVNVLIVTADESPAKQR